MNGKDVSKAYLFSIDLHEKINVKNDGEDTTYESIRDICLGDNKLEVFDNENKSQSIFGNVLKQWNK